MRQSGLLAAAGIYALKNNVARLADDHANADVLADGLIRVVAANSTLAGQVVVHPALTNMVFMDIPTTMVETFVEYLAGQNVKIKAGYQRIKDKTQKRLRWVTHLAVRQREQTHAAEENGSTN